jgi:hypothetical protein
MALACPSDARAWLQWCTALQVAKADILSVMTDDEKHLAECEDTIRVIGRELPTAVNMRQTARYSKLPSKVLAMHIAMRYRVVEMGSAAVESFREGQAVAGAANARGVLETAALFHHIVKRMKQVVADGKTGDADDFLMQALAATRHPKEKNSTILRQSMNIVTRIEAHLDKDLPGMANMYAILCESTHPNYFGLVGAYEQEGSRGYAKIYGSSAHLVHLHQHCLAAALIVFVRCHEELLEIFEPFFKICEAEGEAEFRKARESAFESDEK